MKVALKIIFALFVLVFCKFEIDAQNYKCQKLKSNETTRKWVWSTIGFKEDESFKIVKGVVELAGEPAGDVFVEVFALKNPKRIDGCKTETDGRFSFPNLKKGKYILRLSKEGGFQLTEIQIEVSPNSKNTKPISAVIEVGY